MPAPIEQPQIQAQQQQQQAASAAPQQAQQDIVAQPQQQDLTQQIEEGLSQLPDETKQILAAFAIAPEFGQLIGALMGPEIGDFFTQFADPEITLVAVPKAELDEVLQGIGDTPVSSEGEETLITEEGTDTTAFEQPVEEILQENEATPLNG